MTAAKKLSLIQDEDKNINLANKNSQDQLANYFYKITNHEELFKVGKGFFQEVKKGIKSFAFTSTGYQNSQQRTILGLCCYFDQAADLKIAVISNNLDHSIFNEMLSASAKNVYQLEESNESIEFNSFYHHFDFINYEEFNKIFKSSVYSKQFETEVQKILDKYDVVFWDIPDMEKVKLNPHFHFKISHLYQSLTIIISQNNTNGKEVESVKNFFHNYNINLNGVLFDTTSSKIEKPRKKFLGIF